MNKFRMIKGMLLTVMLLAGCGASGNTVANQTGNELTPAGGSGKMTVISPIIDNEGADPFVIRYQDGYLYTKTTGGNICLGYSSSLMSLGGTELTEIYHPEGELQDFWAPEIWHFEDGWYIYFAALVPGEEMHFMYVLHNPAEDPLSGEWTLSKLDGMDDKFAIDGTVLELDDRKYFIWSGWPGYQNLEQDIYISRKWKRRPE